MADQRVSARERLSRVLSMLERNAGVPPAKRIEFRIGVNLGDVIIEGRDLYGDGVNIAARLEGSAEPGGICISQIVLNHTRQTRPWRDARAATETETALADGAAAIGDIRDVPAVRSPSGRPLRGRQPKARA